MYRYVIIIQLIIVLTMVAVCIASPARFDSLTQEDCLIEWLTALLFIGGGVAAFFSARKAKQRHAPWTTIGGLALLGLALLVVGMEEISWGQRVFDLKTPERLRAINMQEEVNLHNVSTGLSQQIAILGSFLFGICLPAACLLSGGVRRLYEARTHLRAPTPLIAIACLLGYVLCNPEWLLPTLAVGLTYATCGALTATRALSKNDDRACGDTLILVVGMAGSLMVQAGTDLAGPWTNGCMELGEGCLTVAACLLAFSTLSAPPPEATTPACPAPGSPGADSGQPHGE